MSQNRGLPVRINADNGAPWGSQIDYQESLSPIEYPATDTVLTVGWNGFVKFMGRQLRLSNALHQLPGGYPARGNHSPS